MRLILLKLVFLLSFATVAAAQAPLSAIEWLSESIKNPPEFEVEPDTVPLVEAIVQEISVTNGLTPVSPDAIGLLSPAVSGFSANLWGDMSASEISKLLRNHPNVGTPEAKNLFRRILLAQTNPAPDDKQNGLVLQARVARLLEIGAHDAAEALLKFAPVTNPKIFQQKFNVSILTNRTKEVCGLLKSTPAISSDLSTKVYCLARGGDWNAAAITLSLGASIGEIDAAREEMLIRFLDPELFEGKPDPVAPDPLGIMDFVLRESVLLPRPSGLLPLSYLYRDVGNRAPLRAKMEASERLVTAGSLPSNLLFASYREGKAATSGGVWGRAKSVQVLDNALLNGEAATISMALSGAYTEFSNAGLLTAMSNEFAVELAKLNYSSQYSDTKLLVLDLLHLSNISNVTWSNQTVLDDNRQLAMSIVEQAPLIINPAGSAMHRSIVKGLKGPLPDSSAAIQMLGLLEEGRQGQAILAALKLLSGAALADPEGVRAGLYVLSAAGQSAAARRIAVQILLLPIGG